MGKRLRKQLLFVLLLLGVMEAGAAGLPPVFYLGIEHGLSNNEVNCIYQARNGYMWFGTFDGLNRYDGHGFKIFRKKIGDTNSLVSNRVQGIREDGFSRLWIATMGGVSVYDPLREKFTTLTYQPAGKGGERIADNITVLENDVNGDMLVGTVREGLLVYDWKEQRASQVPVLGSKAPGGAYHVTSIEVDRQQRVWLFVEGRGLFRYNRERRTISPVCPTLRQSVCIRSDDAGHLWFGTAAGVYRYHVATGQYLFRPLPKAVTHLHINKEGTLWASTDGGGVYIIGAKGEEPVHLAQQNGKEIFTSMAIKGVWEDAAGRYWVATLRGGINIMDARRHLFKTLTPGTLKKDEYDNYFISSFCEGAGDYVWIGTDGNGISYWNRAAGSFVHFRKEGRNGLSSNNITGILKDHAGRIWVSTWGGGICRYRPESRSFEPFPCIDPVKQTRSPHAWKLFEDAGHTLWASTYGDGGLFRLNHAANRFELFDSTVGNILTMAEDRQGHLWAGTDDRLLRIDRQAKKHLVYQIGYRTRCILNGEEGRLWVATEGGGLLDFDTRTGQYRRYTENEGLPNNAVLNILPGNDGHLWLSTSYGLSRFDTATRKFHNFSASDGLQSNQFSYSGALQLRSGELIFGGIKGFNLFLPKAIRISRSSPTVLLADIKINNARLSDSANFRYVTESTPDAVKRLVLPYHKASLAFDYVAPEYSSANKVSYAYFLEGWDKDWVQAGKARTANYSRLEEGSYTLRIKAAIGEGGWGSETQLAIVVLPPWYRTWWAYSLYVGFACLAVYLYTRYKRKQAAMAYEVLLAQMETKQEKELNEKKLSFFTNITHELRTPLTLIVNPVREMLGRAEDHVKNDLNIVYRNASRLLTLVDQLLLFRTADNDTSLMQVSRLNLYRLCRDTFECFSQMAASKHIRYELKCDNEDVEISGDARKLEIVLFNLISNAIKFTPHHGSITVELKDSGPDVELSVTDTGCGIEDQVKDRLFEKYYRGKKQPENRGAGFGIGLYLVKRFVDCHEGTLECSSAAEHGTSFHIRLKKNQWPGAAPGIAGTAGAAPENRLEQLPEEEEVEMPNIDTLEITEKKSLLIVDDNVELRQYLKKKFTDRYIVYEAGDGARGWEAVQQHVPDIVVSDVLMDEINGVELCRKIKQDPFLNHIPVILLSGLSAPGSRLQGIESGAEDYFTKPFDQELLAARIQAVLENRNALQQYFRDSITLHENSQKISVIYKVFLEKCIMIIENNLDNEGLNPKFLATQCNMSYSNLYKKVKSVSGLSINAFIRSIRLRKAALLILSSNANVNEAACQAGIYDLKYFRKQFKSLYGMNPSEYKKKYQHSFNREFNLIVRAHATY